MQDLSTNQFSFIDILLKADFIVQLVVVALLILSVWSWSIIINKWLLLKRLQANTQHLQSLFNTDGNLINIAQAIKSRMLAPAEYIVIKVINELQKYKGEEANKLSTAQKNQLKSKLQNLMVVYKGNCFDQLESNITPLGTIASSSPFIGLFGTVWGIIHSFQAISITKNASLTAVAPGIAEALFATALGLIAAIPALMCYNILLGKIKSLEIQSDNLLLELNNRLTTILTPEA